MTFFYNSDNIFLQSHKVNLLHIESRPSKNKTDNYEFLIECDNTKGGLKEATDDLKESTTRLHVMSRAKEEELSAGMWSTAIFVIFEGLIVIW